MTSERAFPAVPETLASAATLEIYSDIKSTMGVSLVNLVWRHLAVKPAVLQWAWQTLKPHYASGAVPAAAWLLRESLSTPELHAFNSEEWTQLGQEVATPAEPDAVLGTYERGNAQNLVAMCHLQECLATAKPGSTKTITLTDQQRAAEQLDQARISIPPLPRLDSLSPGIQATISAMTNVWVPAEYRGFTPSVFRHISYWPGILLLYRQRLTALQDHSSDSISLMSQQAIEQASQQAMNLVSSTEKLPALNTKDQQWLQAALDLFIHGMISRGVVIVPAMRTVLANAAVQYNR